MKSNLPLILCLIASVFCGYKAYHTIDEVSAYWGVAFCISILYPIFLTLPLKKK